MNPEVTNARRMANTAWIVLSLWVLFGFCQHEPKMAFGVMGIDLSVSKRIIGIVLFFFPLYAYINYFVRGFIQYPPPKPESDYGNRYYNEAKTIESEKERNELLHKWANGIIVEWWNYLTYRLPLVLIIVWFALYWYMLSFKAFGSIALPCNLILYLTS